MQILISSKAENLAAALAAFRSTVTVEAEYGDQVVVGSVLTLAHHGPRSGNPAPCLAENGVAGPELVEVIGLSHLDLDSLGGLMAVLGAKPESSGFWGLAAFVDTTGPHKLAQAEADAADVDRLYAFWAWSQTHRLSPPRDGSVADVTIEVTEAAKAVTAILADNAELLAAGDAFRLDGEALNKRSFVEIGGEVIVRVSDAFTNHLYSSPDGELAKAVVAFNTVTRGITVSLADPIPGVSARAIVQKLWGGEAGGHDGIAGSPRGRRMGLKDLVRVAQATRALIASTSVECCECGKKVYGLLPGELPGEWATIGCYDGCPECESAYCPTCLPKAEEDPLERRCRLDH